MSKKKKDKGTTTCGALPPIGVGARLSKTGGGNIYVIDHNKTKRKKTINKMTVAETLGDLGNSTGFVGP